ncbi:DNA topoisomerase IV [Algoriphagus sp. NG3]|uniref:DNA topoisomerase IV n=1 Tax=unclassified Algoriphagus TaxID=2641541 RepID=UPI002A8121F5|nr:DNA topoisomerase IV [Algoriphagus sp. NG3]WPR77434.1 DNA topoisomerase IV [Algoriphagus sp. NG3]
MYYRFGKAFYFLSVAFFIFLLLYFYSAMPEQVGYSFDENGLSRDRLSKSSLFYGMIALFIVMNVILLLPPKLLETGNHKGLTRIFPKGDTYRDYYLAWFYSFGGMLNMSLAMLVFYTHAINNQEEIAASQYTFFFYLFPALFVVWVIGLFAILAGKFKQVKNKS